MTDQRDNSGPDAADYIKALEAALTQSQAEVAAAYERAADSVRRLEDGWHDGVSAEYHQHSSAQMKLYAIREIRALATPDQTAALDKLIAEAVGPYVEALAWYGEQARLARLIHSEGDAGRNALQADGGKRAAAILAASKKGGV